MVDYAEDLALYGRRTDSRLMNEEAELVGVGENEFYEIREFRNMMPKRMRLALMPVTSLRKWDGNFMPYYL